ncbi:DUF5916 domain-containing protein [Polaribacter porphyrae]|uniref:Uncharacterized protein n=1 Tax=Polaribacter porphyrae TaxID=1137780 RepID=A0A2S7WQY0_9FLAO|nr:DUF5916 domain-containing protein [Polaribacter porphyrae]PQJ79993.1 hypothetical protein BTO18_12785 [Polaribacter porphyrae]
MKKKYIQILFFSFSICIYAQKKETDNFPPPENPVEIQATKTNNKIIIDGKLDESDWQNAKVITQFFRVEPVQGGNIKNPTEVRILFDDKNLYIGVFAKDSLGKKGVRIQDLRRDFSTTENDVFGIQIDAQNTKQYAVSFQTTPFGNQLDLQSFNDRNRDTNWNALWNVRTTRTNQGYYAEFAIPFKSIRYDKPQKGKPISWGITFYRLARKDFEKTVFPAIPQSFSQNRMVYAAKLTGLELPPPSANIRVEPYALYQYDDTKVGNSTTNKISEPKIGGDVKWVINPKTVVDVTINTDFAQADVDRAVNNLERFNIFFPERRQFFLENSGIWAGSSNFQIKPFFSRTIGLDNSFNAQPAPLDFGTRYTQRDENRTIGALAVRQGATDEAGGSTFGVARYTQNYGKENNFGAMITHRIDDSFNPLNIKNKNNTTITVDGFIRPTPEVSVSYLLSTSIDSETNGLGYSGRIFTGKRTNDYYMGYVNSFVSDTYAPDMGFVFQKDVMYHSPGGYAILRPKKLPFIRRWDPGVFLNYYHDLKDFGNFQQANLYIFPIFMWFKDNSFFEASFTPTWQNINFNFSPLGINIEEDNYSYTRYLLRYNTDQSKKLSGGTRFDFGSFYNGNRNTFTGNLRYAPLPNISLSANYEHNNIKSLGIQKEDLKTDLYSANLRLALNPRLQFNSFYQFNSFDKQGRLNLRLSWEYQPLSFIYLVFNDIDEDQFNPRIQNRQFISKITFLKQF